MQIRTFPATEPEAFSEASTPQPLRDLKIQIVYEDLSAGLRARQTLDWIKARLTGPANLRLELWRFDLLKEPALRAEAANEAMRADVVLLSAHGQHGLPEDVSEWIREWLARQTDDPPALVLLLDADAQGTPPVNEFLLALRCAAEPNGIEIFERYCDTWSAPAQATFESIHQRAETTTLLSDMLLASRAKPPSHWGINE